MDYGFSIFNKETPTPVVPVENPLENWPSKYYQIQTGPQRMEALEAAIEQKLSPADDAFRMEMLKSRFYTISKDGQYDNFMRAWLMIQASSGDSLFLRRHSLAKELEKNMAALWIDREAAADEAEKLLIHREWEDFAARYIDSCLTSPGYSAVIFGLGKMKDSSVAQKIANDIITVTELHPDRLGKKEEFASFAKVVKKVYCKMVPNGLSCLSS